MTGVARSHQDPHWDSILAIAEALLVDGIYVAQLEASAAQARVDLLWSVHEVERIFRLPTRTCTETSSASRHRSVTVTVIREDADGEVVPHGRARLEVLLRAVEGEYLRLVAPPQTPDRE